MILVLFKTRVNEFSTACRLRATAELARCGGDRRVAVSTSRGQRLRRGPLIPSRARARMRRRARPWRRSDLGVTVGVGVAIGVGLGVTVDVGVGVVVGVGVGVGVG